MSDFKRIKKNQSEVYNRKGRNSFGRDDWEDEDDWEEEEELERTEERGNSDDEG